ncbi:hypothetical protein PANPA_00352 (plasmid) [Pantoea sp. Nvir]|jgi:uncharacterized protein YjgD (DUF1641 family)|uniref:DUF1641 domain-containing protein n=1 Tax=Pantoea TaxID=53335 RepID=UPI0006608BBF|nr:MULTISPECIES: DUF1641 domain-containing protein [Pantoea]MBS6435606.1 DUF1641 domain-containing protein [Pantoea sp.]MCG7367718.1 DUF1641 domain-containing protein [Pantoea sp. ACRSH]MCG7398892.1 DUF1641 domain-containing protein [Pantoea sp. ACRSC]MDU1572444.1 DUF1641 domain-containing protein [Pantoea sp.]MDU2727712.1 DUF1641 domain-containing protein [Pantoea sp.]
MAERLSYTVPPTRTEKTAQEAMDELVENLHEHGFLRLANDAIKANNDIGKILVAGLNRPGTQSALQNISLILMTLSTIPPERLNHILLALRDAAMAMKPASDATQQEGNAAPGIRGVLHLLNDEKLWQGLRPLFAALEAFSAGMQREEEKPITRYSGKPSNE